MGKRKNKPNTPPEQSGGVSSGSDTVTVRFTKKNFRHKGVEYSSAAVEKAAAEGDENAIELIARLVQIGSGVVSVTGEKGETPNE